jgi:hypothetical protein
MISPTFALSLDALFLLIAVCGLGLVLQLIGWRVRLLDLLKQRDFAELRAEIASAAADLSEPNDRPRRTRRTKIDPKTK